MQPRTGGPFRGPLHGAVFEMELLLLLTLLPYSLVRRMYGRAGRALVVHDDR